MSFKRHSIIRFSLIWSISVLRITTVYGQPGPLSMTVTTVNPSCNIQVQPVSSSMMGNGSIMAAASGGTPPYHYNIKPLRPPQNNGYFPGLDQGNYLVEVIDALGAYDSINVFLSYTLPQPMLEMNILRLPSSCTNTDGAIQLVGLGGTPPYSFSWDGGQTYAPTPTFMTNLQQGYYWGFLVKDANGCLAGAETNDTRFSNGYFMCFLCCNLELSLVVDSFSCTNNGQFSVSVPNTAQPIYYSLDGVNYQVANGTNGNVNVFAHATPGVYHVYAKSADGLLTGQTTVTMGKACPLSSLRFQTSQSSCNGSDGSITIMAGFGIPLYTYSMDGVNYQTSNVFSGLSAGSYGLSVKDSRGAIQSGIATVVNGPGPVITAVSAPPFCSNAVGTITVSAAGGTSPLQYSFDNGHSWQPSNSQAVRSAGLFALVVRDANGCVVSVPETVTTLDTPVVSLGRDTGICISDSVLLTVGDLAAGDQYVWQDNSTADQYWVRRPGTFSVVATNALGCAGAGTIVISGKPLPVFTLGADMAVCPGQPALLDPQSSDVTYLWSTGSTSASLLATQPGLYWLQEDLAQCLYRDSIIVLFKPAPSVHLGDDTTICEGQVLFLDASFPGATYRWQDGTTAPQFKVTSAGTYIVHVDVDGCDSSAAIAIGYITKPLVKLVPDTTACLSQVLVLDATYPQSTYLWQDGSTQPQIRVAAEGTYSVQVTNVCGTTEDSSIVKYDNCACRVYVPTGFTPNGDGRNDMFKAGGKCLYTHFEMKVFGRWGQLLFQTSDPSVGWDGNWQGRPQPTGVYVWMVAYQDQLTGKRFEQKGTVMLIR